MFKTFNEDKAFKIAVNGAIVGTCRVIVTTHTRHAPKHLFLALFVGKEFASNSDLLDAVFYELQFAAKQIQRRQRGKAYIVSKYLPPLPCSDFAYALEPVRQFGSTARMRGSSVLLDEVTGKPLY